MGFDYLFQSIQDTRHKVFISYYHREDEFYRRKFESLFRHLFMNKSVRPGDIETDVSDEYIKRLIRENYIFDTSVLVVLVGPKTRCRKHVDWEIYAALMRKAGVLGILLPEFPITSDGRYRYDSLPPRLADNVKTGYAQVYLWNWVCASEDRIKMAIEEAFKARAEKAYLINNTSLQFRKNRCE